MIRWQVVVNPHAAGNRNRARLASALRILEPYAERTVFTERAGHAEALARDSSGYDGLVVVGGDGTLAEVVNGIDWSRKTVAVIPAGRGNSVSKGLGLRNARACVDAIAAERTVCVDLLELNYEDGAGLRRHRYSAGMIALGYPATVTAVANRRFRSLGRLSYVAAAGVASVRPPRFDLEIRYGDASPERKRLSGLLVSNMPDVGTFHAFPRASHNDGLFDLMELDAGFIKQNIHNLSILTRTFLYPRMPSVQLGSASILLDKPQDLMVDGDIVASVKRMHISVIPDRLTCYCGDGEP